ncbi:hypothetical protein E2542_SST18603 [Spatholobus suberectus]|nr:hypothetical protein E2542_SST18603 [Spatholobus suberectus]
MKASLCDIGLFQEKKYSQKEREGNKTRTTVSEGFCSNTMNLDLVEDDDSHSSATFCASRFALGFATQPDSTRKRARGSTETCLTSKSSRSCYGGPSGRALPAPPSRSPPAPTTASSGCCGSTGGPRTRPQWRQSGGVGLVGVEGDRAPPTYHGGGGGRAVVTEVIESFELARPSVCILARV